MVIRHTQIVISCVPTMASINTRWSSLFEAPLSDFTIHQKVIRGQLTKKTPLTGHQNTMAKVLVPHIILNLKIGFHNSCLLISASRKGRGYTVHVLLIAGLGEEEDGKHSRRQGNIAYCELIKVPARDRST